MCGICGIVTNGRQVEQDTLNRMNSTLAHRGPDESNTMIWDNAGLGHRRLSIIDLSTGKQPLSNEDDSKLIVFNGEIYNFQEIRQRLEQRGHIFKTRSDTEAILHLYEDEKEDCVKQLRGMFAFAIYDKIENKLFLARDRIGKKPLYYGIKNGDLFFASEIKALLSVGVFSKDIDFEAFADYLTYLFVPSPKSIFKEIRKLRPGFSLTFQNGHITEKQFWDISFRPDFSRSITSWIDELDALLRECINIRLMSEVPLGAFLSGGIDSSVIVGLMSKINNESIKTHSIGFADSKFNELPFAKQTSDHFKTTHHEYIVDIESKEVLKKLAWYFDEPFADSSSLPTYYVSKMTRQNVTVALSGDGGDENFAGYSKYSQDLKEYAIRNSIPGFIRNLVLKPLAEIYPKNDTFPSLFRLKSVLTSIAETDAWGAYNSLSHCSEQLRNELIHPDILHVLRGYDPFVVYENHYNNAKAMDYLSRTQYCDMKLYLPDDILVKVDRASMAVSLEVRVPLLDHKFIEFAASIPSSLKLKNGISKYIFKQYSRTLLPDELLNRKKMGFSIPVDNWFRTELRAFFEETVFRNDSKASSFLNTAGIEKLWQKHLCGTLNAGYQLWTILMFYLWADNYL